MIEEDHSQRSHQLSANIPQRCFCPTPTLYAGSLATWRNCGKHSTAYSVKLLHLKSNWRTDNWWYYSVLQRQSRGRPLIHSYYAAVRCTVQVDADEIEKLIGSALCKTCQLDRSGCNLAGQGHAWSDYSHYSLLCCSTSHCQLAVFRPCLN